MYTLTLTFLDGKTKNERTATVKKCVANYFDENGVFCYDLFEPVVENLKYEVQEKKSQ